MSYARNKLLEAEYFLNRMRTLGVGTDELMFNLSAFLSASRSAFDVLLYDYGTRWGLFSVSDCIYPSCFRRIARTSNNPEAERFINWYDQEFQSLENDPVAGFLIKKRNIIVHRARPAMAWSLFLADTLAFSDTITASGPPPPGVISPSSAIPGPLTLSTSLTGYFDDYRCEDILSLCQKFLAVMENVVLEAENLFP